VSRILRVRIGDTPAQLGINREGRSGSIGSLAAAQVHLFRDMSAVTHSQTGFTKAEIDAGRRLFAGEWDFISAASSLASLPAAAGPEIAFAGRSNVGKSSLINAITGRRALARTSNTPGRTQNLIFFGGPRPLVLVDMPGYGYAAAAKNKISAWTALIHEYLQGRTTLARVYLLVDARHGLKEVDTAILDALGEAAVSHEIVLTKCDQVGASELAERIADLNTGMRKRPAAFPDLVATSARTGAGIDLLRAAIARLLAEREHV
jgi:GTP-binding protein